MFRLPSLRFTRIGRVVFLVHGPEAPAEDDWTEFVERAWSYDEVEANMRALVLTDGTGPDALQRESLLRRVEHYGTTTSSIVTGSRKARLIGTAVRWFVPDVKFFAPEQLAEALTFLGLEDHERAAAIRGGLELIDDGRAPAWETRLRRL